VLGIDASAKMARPVLEGWVGDFYGIPVRSTLDAIAHLGGQPAVNVYSGVFR
jgi:hypothetical protein